MTTAKAISAYKAKKNALFNRLKRAVSKDSFSSVNSTSVVGGGIFYSQSSSSSSLSKAAAGTLSFLTAAGSSTGSIGFEMGNSIWKSISSTTSSIMTGGGGVGGSYITDTKGELQKDFTDENAKDTSTGSIGRSRGHEIAGFAENWIPDQEVIILKK